LGWTHTTPFEQLVDEMVEADIALFTRNRYLLDGGHDVFQAIE
jgi:hypothetical protein